MRIQWTPSPLYIQVCGPYKKPSNSSFDCLFDTYSLTDDVLCLELSLYTVAVDVSIPELEPNRVLGRLRLFPPSSLSLRQRFSSPVLPASLCHNFARASVSRWWTTEPELVWPITASAQTAGCKARQSAIYFLVLPTLSTWCPWICRKGQ